ncbi:hypothetical protein DFH08DRAFT_951130 [Mycena albidolilacea]|uniref:Transmembrane protein n=1 Tax=Mycena albidolilacea TaxID=1033008 RepID=A0AAD7AN57_9AGAR|nr:hypothetical protein DFH08DRAFT_951130 [Mycena albidolilacea]
MARPRRRSLFTNPCFYFILLVLSTFTYWLEIKAALPQTAHLFLGISAGAFITAVALLVSFVRDAREYIRGTPSDEGATLEAGLNSQSAPLGLASPVSEIQHGQDMSTFGVLAPTSAEDNETPGLTLRPAGKVFAAVVCGAGFATDLWLRQLISPQVPALENAKKALLHLFAGLEVLFAVVMLFLAVVLWRSRRGAPLGSRWTGDVVLEGGSDAELQADEGCVLTDSEELDVKPEESPSAEEPDS